MHQPSIIAHRGASGHFPENTIKAFVEAVKSGADGIEMDVRLSADNVPMVIHDPAVLDEDEQVMVISQMKAREINDHGGAKEADENIPTLTQVLARIPMSRTCFIELKDGAKLAQRIISVVDSMRVDATNTWFLSFSLATLSEIKSYRKHWNCMLLVPPPGETDGRGLNYYITMAHHGGVEGIGIANEWRHHDEEIPDVKLAGLELSVWTVNEPEDFDFWVEQGVKYVTTDFPERFVPTEVEETEELSETEGS